MSIVEGLPLHLVGPLGDEPFISHPLDVDDIFFQELNQHCRIDQPPSQANSRQEVSSDHCVTLKVLLALLLPLQVEVDGLGSQNGVFSGQGLILVHNLSFKRKSFKFKLLLPAMLPAIKVAASWLP